MADPRFFAVNGPHTLDEVAETYDRLRSSGADFTYYLTAHVRLCKRQEDANHWVEGYRKARFDI